MNERIRQLLEQAKTESSQWLGSKPATTITYDELEKFAELIVQECYDTIKKDMELAHIQLIPIDFGIYANGRLRRIINEHFGVEE